MDQPASARPGGSTPPPDIPVPVIAAASPIPLPEPSSSGSRPSLREVAWSDLCAALQLLAQRAQFVTGASGVAIALREGEHMICRASSGAAPEIGALLSVNSGLSGESVRTGQRLCCDDANTDPRVNRETCVALGIISAVIIPLRREEQIVGVFELFSSRPHAFEDRDLETLDRLTETVQTAIEQACAIDAMEETLQRRPGKHPLESGTMATDAPASPAVLRWSRPETEVPAQEPSPRSAAQTAMAAPLVATCSACGFPVSQGRKLCVDCEASHANAETVPRFLGEMAKIKPAWKSPHTYLLAFLMIFLLLFAVLTAMR